MLVVSSGLIHSLPEQKLDRLADRQLLASIMRTEEETRRVIAQSYEMVADTRKQIAEMDMMRRSCAVWPFDKFTSDRMPD
jgi:hypothetical protein